MRKYLVNLVLFKTPIGEILNAIDSLFRHLKYSFSEEKCERNEDALRAYVTKLCHVIEKGMALPNTRLGFGEVKIKKLIEHSERYMLLKGEDKLILMVKSALRDYLYFHKGNESYVNVELIHQIELFNGDLCTNKLGGVEVLDHSDEDKATRSVFEKIVMGRRSVRQFSGEIIPLSTLKEALELAKNSPSVCNRQGWKFHLYHEKEKINSMLELQNGNSGFGSSGDKLLVITGDSRAFTRYEQSQLFVDGGLVSMNIMLALHSFGIASCPLNTCLPFYMEAMLRRRGEIPPNEKLVMMIVLGGYRPKYSVAKSLKRDLNDIMRVHD